MSHPSPQAKPSNPSNPRVFFDVDIGGERGEARRPRVGVSGLGARLGPGAALARGAGGGDGCPQRALEQYYRLVLASGVGPNPRPCAGAVGCKEVSGNFWSGMVAVFRLVSGFVFTSQPPSTITLA